MNHPFKMFAHTNFQCEENVRNINFDDLRCVTIFSPPGSQSLTAVRSVIYPLLFSVSRGSETFKSSEQPTSREVNYISIAIEIPR